MRKMYPAARGPLSDVPASGPAPALMRFDEWAMVRPHAGRCIHCCAECLCGVSRRAFGACAAPAGSVVHSHASARTCSPV